MICSMTLMSRTRKYVDLACLKCRIKKTRCDGKTPCSNCKTKKFECEYPTHKKKRGPIFKSKYRKIPNLLNG